MRNSSGKKADFFIGILKEELPYLNEKFNVKRIVIFGSWARGKQTADSDIDLLVEFTKPVGFFKFMDLEYYLIEKLARIVDLVTQEALKSLTRTHILEEVVFA